MKNRINRLAPPGFETVAEIKVYGTGLLAAFLYSLQFLFRYDTSRDLLFRYSGTDREIIRGAAMEDFVELADGAFTGFIILLLIMLGYIFIHYRYHYKGAMSIYLMRRLPDRMELHRRCFALPLIGIAVTLLTAALLLAVYFAVYMLLTPPEVLTPGQFEKLWRGIL